MISGALGKDFSELYKAVTKCLRKTTEKGNDVFWFTIHQLLAHGQLALLLLGFGANYGRAKLLTSWWLGTRD